MLKDKKNKTAIRIFYDLLSDDLTNSCKQELKNFFNVTFNLDSVKLDSFLTGTHLISSPLKVVGFKDGEAVAYFTKVVTEKNLDMLNIISAVKNLGFKILVGVEDTFYDRFESTFSAISFEHNCLKSFKKAGISVPELVGVYQLNTCSLLVSEFVAGTSLGTVEITPAEIHKVLNIIKKLREHELVHGDIKLDNFIIDCSDKIFLIDCMRCNSSLEKALNYDLMCAMYSLTCKYDASSVLEISQKFFSRVEISEALTFLSLTSARFDSILKKDRTKEIMLAQVTSKF